MSDNIDNPHAEQTRRPGTSRREFLQATGMATFATVAANSAVGVSVGDPSLMPETSSGPGRVENLTDYIADPGLFEQGTEPTHTTAAVPFGSRGAGCGRTVHETRNAVRRIEVYRTARRGVGFQVLHPPRQSTRQLRGCHGLGANRRSGRLADAGLRPTHLPEHEHHVGRVRPSARRESRPAIRHRDSGHESDRNLPKDGRGAVELGRAGSVHPLRVGQAGVLPLG
jgi:hypothetical protein